MATKPMTVSEHRGWVRYWLRQARLYVKDREWLRASDAFRSAAFHQRILEIIKAR